MIIVKCNTCGDEVEVKLAPDATHILPQGWKETTPIVQNAPSPRAAVHECGKPQCVLTWTKPQDSKEGEWETAQRNR